jgi:hypothetical protein
LIIRYHGQFRKEDEMNKGSASGALGGAIWFMGWLFTIGFVNLVWWKIILGIVVWPLFLGQFLR